MEMLESPLSHEPRYRINAVSEMTGLSAPNLRAWERRYGIPNPQRGENAYRLYSNRDITLLRKMKALCDEGHAPSDAAKIALSVLEAPEEDERILMGLEDAKQAIVRATRDFKPMTIERVLNRIGSLGSAWMIYEQALEPALIEVGALWESDERYVAHEHMLSQAIKSHLAQLLQLLQPPKPRKRVLFACVAHELHDIPIYALALRVSHLGCLPIMLGANTPPEALMTAVESLDPDLVILSATTAMTIHPRLNSSKPSKSTPQSMGQFESLRGQSSWESRRDISTNAAALTLSPPVLESASLVSQLRAYQEACGDVPWLIGGQAVAQWSELPEDLKAHTTSSHVKLDDLIN